jgi:hypothetical protein
VLGRCGLLDFAGGTGSTLRARIHLASIALSASLAGIVAACSLTTSLDGFATGPVADAGPAPIEGGPIVADGGAPGDGSTTEAGVDAAPTPFRCSDHENALFCADFESVPVTAGWKNVATPSGGSLSADQGRFGMGLAASVPDYSSPNEPAASLESGLSLTTRQPFTFSVDTKIATLKGSGVIDFIAFGFHGEFYILVLRAGDNGHVDLYEYADPVGTTTPQLDHYQQLLVQPTLGSWMHVVGQVTFPASGAHLKLTFDGTLAFDGAISAGDYASRPYLYAGITHASSGGDAMTILFDDILVTTP